MSRRHLDAADELEAPPWSRRAMVRELRQLADAAPDGQVPTRVEKATELEEKAV